MAADPGDFTDVHHLTCCDDDVALCGKDVSAEPECDPGCANPPCPLCATILAEGQPCAVADCEPQEAGQ